MKKTKLLYKGVFSALGALTLMRFLSAPGDAAAAEPGYIDTHNHAPMKATCIYDTAYDKQIKTVVLDAMDDFDVQKTFFMPPPHSPKNLPSCNYDHLAEIAKRRRDRFAFLLGGESLNPVIHSVKHDKVTGEIKETFQKKAVEILRSGAIGFGEMAAEHFSLHQGHPYMSAPADHPLFLLLADLAAGHDVPIDLHMEAIDHDIPLSDICDISEACWSDPPATNPNPSTLHENISAFEQLLRHNRNARIIWVHAGWDNTGHRTVGLMRDLLEDHPNLYLQLKFPKGGKPKKNRILDQDEQIKEEWLTLIGDFPDRFIIGLDSFYSPFKPGQTQEEFLEILKGVLEDGSNFVEQLYQKLPKDVADKVAFENAIRIYRLDQIMVCHGQGTPGERTLRVDANALQGHVAHGDALGPCG